MYFPDISRLASLMADGSHNSAVFSFDCAQATLDFVESRLRFCPNFQLSFECLGGKQASLRFLERVPSLRRLALSSERNALHDTSALKALKNLESLTLKVPALGLLEDCAQTLSNLRINTNEKSLELSPVRHCRGLKSLHLSGRAKQVEAVSRLPGLEELSFWDVDLGETHFLSALVRLKFLEIKSCKTKELAGLSSLKALRSLRLIRLRTPTNLEFLNGLTELRFLQLEALPKISSLAEIALLPNLEGLSCESLKRVADFTPLRSANRLNQFYLGSAKGISVSDFDFLLSHPSLKTVGICFGAESANREFREKFTANGFAVQKRIDSWDR